MGILNRMALRGLVTAHGIVKRRIDVCNQAIELLASNGVGPRDERMMTWQLHKARLTNRFADMALRIADRAQQERGGAR